jgi:ABC-2 type transport system permease protein
VIALLLHSLQRVRSLVLVIGLLLCLLQVILILVARSLDTGGQFAQLATLLPPFLRELLGPSVTAFLSFGGIVSLGYFEPGVIFAMVGLAIALGTRIAYEVETGFIDVMLARPVPRHWMVTRAILVNTLSLGFVVTLMLLGTWGGLSTLAPATAEMPSASMIAGMAVNLGLLGLAWSSIGLAVACASRRRGVAAGIAGIGALVLFLLEYVSDLWDPAKPFGKLSPFHYYDPLAMVTGGALPMGDVAVLAATALGGCATAYFLFLRRDISR